MQYRVYSDLNPSSTTVLEGFKGQTFLEEPGYVFAPYVPLQVTPLMQRTHRDLKLASLKTITKRSIITRHDKKKKPEPDWYGTIKIIDSDE